MVHKDLTANSSDPNLYVIGGGDQHRIDITETGRAVMDFPQDGSSSHERPIGQSGGVVPWIADLLGDRNLQARVQRGTVSEPEWRNGLRALCDEARAERVLPEQLLIEVKQALAILCDSHRVPHGIARTEFISRVVTLCIEEYYAGLGRDP